MDKHSKEVKKEGRISLGFRKGLFIYFLLLVGIFLLFLMVCLIPAKYTQTSCIEDYGKYTGTNDNATVRAHIGSFFPEEIEESFQVVRYSYRAENEDTYGYEAYLEIHISDPEEFKNYIASLAPAEGWTVFSSNDSYLIYTISDTLDIYTEPCACVDADADHGYHIAYADMRTILYSNESQTIIFSAIGVFDGGGATTGYLRVFFDRFDIDPLEYSEAIKSFQPASA